MVGRGLCLDFSHKAPGEFVTADMIRERLRERGLALRPGDIVLLRVWPGPWGGEGFFECQGPDESAGGSLLLEAGVAFLGLTSPSRTSSATCGDLST